MATATELLNNAVMNELENILANTKETDTTFIINWNCGGACEGLSTPIV